MKLKIPQIYVSNVSCKKWKMFKITFIVLIFVFLFFTTFIVPAFLLSIYYPIIINTSWNLFWRWRGSFLGAKSISQFHFAIKSTLCTPWANYMSFFIATNQIQGKHDLFKKIFTFKDFPRGRFRILGYCYKLIQSFRVYWFTHYWSSWCIYTGYIPVYWFIQYWRS